MTHEREPFVPLAPIIHTVRSCLTWSRDPIPPIPPLTVPVDPSVYSSLPMHPLPAVHRSATVPSHSPLAHTVELPHEMLAPPTMQPPLRLPATVPIAVRVNDFDLGSRLVHARGTWPQQRLQLRKRKPSDKGVLRLRRVRGCRLYECIYASPTCTTYLSMILLSRHCPLSSPGPSLSLRPVLALRTSHPRLPKPSLHLRLVGCPRMRAA